MEAKNLKEFKALIKRYESITLKEIKAEDITEARYILTGFAIDCPLCGNCRPGCIGCVYGSRMGCVKGNNRKTFKGISNADTPIRLRNAYRARAKHMKTLI